VLPVLEAALAAGQSALQAIFRGLESAPPGASRAAELPLAPDEEGALHDWDCPSDIGAGTPTS